jgi:two-component system sensor histidine kinase MtrB
VAAAVLLTATLSAATFLTVGRVLENNRVRSDTRQTIFALLFAREFLASNPGRQQRLVTLLQTREKFDAMVTTGTDWVSTEFSLTPDVVPGALRALVGRERLGYQYVHLAGIRTLVFGSPLPAPRTDLYLFYSLEDVDQTLGLLARVLTVVGIAAVLAAAVLAQLVSRRILRPLAAVSEAARRVAEGLLETRVETSSADEVGLMAASFNRMAAALQEMLARERRFVAAVSHELRTPLTALHTTSQVLAARRDELPPPAREAADLVAEDVANLKRLVEELLEISELDAGGPTLGLEDVELRSVAEAVVRRRRRDVPIDGSLVVRADKARLERILGNLVDNAFQHGGGRDVRIRIGRQDHAGTIAVTDRGPGVAPEDLPHLFERFYKADRSRSRGGGGIGLGLAIADQNARLLGGTLEVSSRPGEGSTFVLRLPLSPDQEADP